MSVTCDDKNLSWEEIERMKYVRDDDGNIALRVVEANAEDPLTCDTKDATDVLARRSSVRIAEGRYATRIVITT